MVKKSDEAPEAFDALINALSRYGTIQRQEDESFLLMEEGYLLIDTTVDQRTGTKTYVFGKLRERFGVEGGSRFVDLTTDTETGVKRYVLRTLPKFVRELTKDRDAKGAKLGERFNVKLVYLADYEHTLKSRVSEDAAVNEKKRLRIPRVTSKSKSDLTMLFDSALTEAEVTDCFHAIADYFRACGGLGLAVKFDHQQEPTSAENSIPNKRPRRA